MLRKDKDAAAFGEFSLDASGRVGGFLSKNYSAMSLEGGYMYVGVQVISKRVLADMPSRGSVFSITKDTFVEILRAGGSIQSFVYDGYWADLGTPERLEEARSKFQ